MQENRGYTAIDLAVFDAESHIRPEFDQNDGIKLGDSVMQLGLVIFSISHGDANNKHDEHDYKGDDCDVGSLEVGFDELNVVVSDHA